MPSEVVLHWLDELDGLIIEGDILDSLASLEDESVEAIVTDPPYELGFMGKSWDNQGVSFRTETWAACLRVLKPGGHIIVFGGTRTHHRMWCAIEDAGFEVREMLLWLYGQGMPKSLDVSKAIDKAAGEERPVVGTSPSGGYKRLMVTNKEANFRPDDYYPEGNKFRSNEPITDDAHSWSGWGTGLKPAVEPILLARKPISEKTVAANVLKHGTGALNIDATRNAYISDKEHRALVAQLLEIKGMAILSGYDNKIYAPLGVAHWRKRIIKRANMAARVERGVKRGTQEECVWFSPTYPKAAIRVETTPDA